MSTFRLTTIEEFEAATQRLLETGAKVGHHGALPYHKESAQRYLRM